MMIKRTALIALTIVTFCEIAFCNISKNVMAQTKLADAVGKKQNGTVPKICPIRISKEGWNHCGDASPENLKRLADLGATATASWVGHPRQPFDNLKWWADPCAMSYLENVAKDCKKSGLDFYLVTFIGASIENYPDGKKLAISKDMDGKGESEPSWLDPNYWEMIIERDSSVAKLAAGGLVKGILFDPEIYQPGALMERGQLDFGDVAYKRFAAYIGMKTAMPEPNERAKQLMNTGLIGAYFEWQAKEIENFARTYKNALRKVAPNIELGYYNPGMWHSAWPLRSLARGLYDGGKPILILDASTYSGVGKSWTLGWEEESLSKYSEMVYKILYDDWKVTYPSSPSYVESPVWKRCLNPASISDFLKEAARNGNGWWIYNETGDPNQVIKDIAVSQLGANK